MDVDDRTIDVETIHQQLSLLNIPTESLLRGKTPLSNQCPGYIKPYNAGTWGNAEYPFIAIAPQPTLALRSCT